MKTVVKLMVVLVTSRPPIRSPAGPPSHLRARRKRTGQSTTERRGERRATGRGAKRPEIRRRRRRRREEEAFCARK